MKKISLLIFTVITSFCANAQLLYTFDSVKTTSGTIDPSPVPIVTGITCGTFAATGTPPNSLAAFRFDFSDWSLGSVGGVADTLFSGMTGAISTAEYYEVTLTPQAGYSITGDSIKFSFERSGTGIRTYAVRSNLDGYTANLNAVYGIPTTNVDVQAGNVFFLKKDITTIQNRNIIVLGASFANMVVPVTFRFYGWNAEASTGTFSIDNVNFIGSSTLATGVSEKNNMDITLFPNPSQSGLFTIDLNNLSGKSNIRIYDIIGNIIYSTETSSIAKQTIDLSNVANGSYFVSITNNNGTTTKKIVVNK
jgi:hypothetical protein